MMKRRQVLLLGICLLLISSLVAAQYGYGYVRRQPTGREGSSSGGMMTRPMMVDKPAGMMMQGSNKGDRNLVTSDIVSYLRESAKMRALNLVFIDPATLKQLSLMSIATASDDFLKTMLSSGHNRRVLETLRNKMMAERKIKARQTSSEAAKLIRMRQTRTLVTEPVERYGTRSSEYLISDSQLENVLKCSGVVGRGTFFNVLTKKIDSFDRWNFAGEYDKATLRKIIGTSPQQTPCVTRALRGRA